MAAPQPPPSVLPYEILEKIVSKIPISEKCTLRSCALTSKAFLFPAQCSIFFEISLRTATYVPILVDIFKASPHLGTYVRELELDGHPESTRDAEQLALLFRLMPSVHRLLVTRISHEALWDIMRSALEEVILPQLRYLNIWQTCSAPLWLLSSSHPLNELKLNDCPKSVVDNVTLGAGSVQRVNPLPLRYLRIAHSSDTLDDLLLHSVTQLVALELPIRTRFHGGLSDRSELPLQRVAKLMSPMVNTLVCLDIDAWPILCLSEIKISDHPFFIGRYPCLRYFSIHLRLEFIDDHNFVANDLNAQMEWLSNMLNEVPSSHPHPLTYLDIYLDKWWLIVDSDASMQALWSKLDLALAGDRSNTFPHMKALRFSPKTRAEYVTDDMELLLPLVDARGVLVLNKDRRSWRSVW
ncbi:hypothetical protein DL96DRAFT_148184 [Flagelloscypha sp. PMI_526]|nr:hypothetical protein DL96DRAFT_148184 [Flagelloscypha sp. PMI_526]